MGHQTSNPVKLKVWFLVITVYEIVNVNEMMIMMIDSGMLYAENKHTP